MVRQRLIRGTNQGFWQLCGQPGEKKDEEIPPANRALLLHMATTNLCKGCEFLWCSFTSVSARGKLCEGRIAHATHEHSCKRAPSFSYTSHQTDQGRFLAYLIIAKSF